MNKFELQPVSSAMEHQIEHNETGGLHARKAEKVFWNKGGTTDH